MQSLGVRNLLPVTLHPRGEGLVPWPGNIVLLKLAMPGDDTAQGINLKVISFTPYTPDIWFFFYQFGLWLLFWGYTQDSSGLTLGSTLRNNSGRTWGTIWDAKIKLGLAMLKADTLSTVPSLWSILCILGSHWPVFHPWSYLQPRNVFVLLEWPHQYSLLCALGSLLMVLKQPHAVLRMQMALQNECKYLHLFTISLISFHFCLVIIVNLALRIPANWK